MQLNAFHPATAAWLQRAFAAPTEAQLRAWPAIREGRHTLIAAPTGSGKTLAAFLAAIDDLVRTGLAQGLKDECQVLYVSPLKALSNDIQKNLQAPLEGIRAELLNLGLPDVGIRAWVRSGDTPQSERERMRRTPPHILVTTPESLYILLTSESGRRMLATVRTVIVDEIHALAGNKRGAHLALSLERLNALCGHAPARIGLSATQKPIEEVARFLIGTAGDCNIIDTGHVRERRLEMEMPKSPLGAVMANEVWAEIYDRLTELILSHKTTLIFANTRRLAERAARHLAERIGEEHVTAHHGSLARAHRLDAEQRLKRGELKALVATASLELGIDIGEVDLVCQLGSPRSIGTFLQRVGRSGHAVSALPEGHLFPLSRDELVECAALLDCVRRGELDRIRFPVAPLDVLAQQIVAEVAAREWDEVELFERFRHAYPYRELTREAFTDVLRMLADGFSTRRGRRSAYLHRDAVNGKLRGRRGARLVAITNGGAIPDQFDYDVVLSPEGLHVGTLNEDFAFESIPGDIFQLGNTSYRILKLEQGKVYVADAKGQPPNIPFWFGEAPGRSAELSAAVSRLRKTAEQKLCAGEDLKVWLENDIGLDVAAATQLQDYLTTTHAALGVLPTQDTVVFERFFDETGDQHLVIHSPFGSRLNRAWGLALRKRFCRKFNFELQAAALEDTIVLSLGATHSFPLEEAARYLHSASAREVLEQAVLAAPMFGTRWRWVVTTALAVQRNRNGKRTPPAFQRADAEDLVAVVFPDQLACAENLAGAREIPDHPLVQQTLNDCLHEVMDVDAFISVLQRLESGDLKVVARDISTPSPLAQEILGARPYAFLDDAPAEERRTLAVQSRGVMNPEEAGELAQLDPQAIARVRAEVWPDPRDADELHDALTVLGFVTEQEAVSGTPASLLPLPSGEGSARSDERAARGALRSNARIARDGNPGHEYEAWIAQYSCSPGLSGEAGLPSLKGGEDRVDTARSFNWSHLLEQLINAHRATRLQLNSGGKLWVAAERLAELLTVYPEAVLDPLIDPVKEPDNEPLTRDDALRELLRSRLEGLGPVTATELARPLGLAPAEIDTLLLGLEAQGGVMRGRFSNASSTLSPLAGESGSEGKLLIEWCDRRLLARIHRYTLKRLRSEIEPVASADYLRFLLDWHGLNERSEGKAALAAALEQLEGYSAPAAAWEEDILPARISDYAPYYLDQLCAGGLVAWARLAPPRSVSDDERKAGPVRGTPIALVYRENLPHWHALVTASDATHFNLSHAAQTILVALQQHGALFFGDIVDSSGLLRTQAETALGELTAWGLVTADGFAGLRALITPQHRRPPIGSHSRYRMRRGYTPGVDEAGRWSSVPRVTVEQEHVVGAEAILHIARALLGRYGVVFRQVLTRESGLPPWRDLLYSYRRLEARGEIRGGRFVQGFSGEQFALPEAVGALREWRKRPKTGALVSLSAADPLNLVGVILPGERVPMQGDNRVLYRDGVPVAVQVAEEVKFLEQVTAETEWTLRNRLLRKQASQMSGVIQ